MFIFSGSEYEVGVWSFIWDSRQYIFIEQFIFFLFLSVYFLCIMIDKENLQDQQKILEIFYACCVFYACLSIYQLCLQQEKTDDL